MSIFFSRGTIVKFAWFEQKRPITNLTWIAPSLHDHLIDA